MAMYVCDMCVGDRARARERERERGFRRVVYVARTTSVDIYPGTDRPAGRPHVRMSVYVRSIDAPIDRSTSIVGARVARKTSRTDDDDDDDDDDDGDG